ncbi:kinase-like protein [Suhomyces tanzawaensis NRRL Y-17324]|uniref:non-specific serine/threonine protein kinase n=1 Tax=Suhomyces tanzawaensis NRRL Y-17324 TaxID=984487 RepID=A0A1E4SRI6_9ASCO|nr:kinase-like protein [Suhomyces tanzawaensis NRRL Y-17324]ODV82126.1 kinase-like protein [Suhomyces tanzawaensis NRRL Y-17324]
MTAFSEIDDSKLQALALGSPDVAAAAAAPKPKKTSLRSLLGLGAAHEDLAETSATTSAANASTTSAYDEDLTAYLLDLESDLNFDPKAEESEHDYRHGGYHPVAKGETYYLRKLPQREYIILRKLGWGHFSTVWLAKSRYNASLARSGASAGATTTDTAERYVAIKFVKSHKNYIEAAEDEIRILNTLNNPAANALHLQAGHFQVPSANAQGYKHVMRLLDDFEVVGPNGCHIAMVFEILGENVLNLIHKYKHFYNDVSKELAKKDQADKPARPYADDPVSPTDTSGIKFSKLDAKPKKTTKSKLSMGLSLNLGLNLLKNRLHTLNSESLMGLIQRQKNAGAIPLSFVRQIVRQMLLAMDYVHRCGIIHTDLKPENILVEVKDVNNLIRVLEHDDIARSNSIDARTKAAVRKNSASAFQGGPKKLVRQGTSESIKSRNLSIASTGSSQISGLYKKSRNSTSCECPVRTSKPLSSSLNNDVFFKEVSYDSRSRVPKSFSPLSKSKWQNSKTSDESISIKIADLGNATFSHSHFTNQIQTRQYRSPEIIMKYKSWGASTDMWSIGCIIFELITGDYLFDPCNGKFFDKDEDHLAQIIELLGAYPSDEYLIDSKLTSKFFKLDPATNKVVLKNIDSLKMWGLEDVLVEKYKFDKDDIQVKLISDLILKCLTFNLHERFDCGSLLKHPWLRDGEYTEDMLDEINHMVNNHEGVPGFTDVWGEEY